MITRSIMLFVCVLFSCGLSVDSAFGLGTEEFGDRPIEISCEWYDGVAQVAKSPGRVYSRWVNGGEIFCYKSDTKGINKVLKRFAAVSAPRRTLIIRKEKGIQKSFHGKEISFDWKLEVVGGISRAVLLHQKGMKAKELYPSITLFLGNRNIKLDELDVPAGIDVTISESVKADADLLKVVNEIDKWRQAEEKWQAFVEPYLEKIRKEDSDPSIGCVEIRSKLISEILSRHRIYAIETRKFKRPSLLAVSIEGEITDLSKHSMSRRASDNYVSYQSIANLLEKQNIVVSDANAAVSVTQLFEDLSGGSRTVFDLKFNTAGFGILDKRLYRSICQDLDWDYSAEKQENIWIVKKNYVGPKTCLAYASSFEIIIDEKDRFEGIWRTPW
jgi:hypothetical protein